MLIGPDGESVGVAQLQAREVAISKESAQIAQSAQQLNTSAGSGFHLEPQAAATLIQSCMHSLDELNGLQAHLNTVTQEPQLGTTPGANVIAPFTQSVATDPQGIQLAIANLRQTIQDMMHAYQKASTNYNETESIVAAAMAKVKSQA